MSAGRDRPKKRSGSGSRRSISSRRLPRPRFTRAQPTASGQGPGGGEGHGAKGEEFLSPSAAGRELGVTGEAVKQWIYRRKLPATKLPNGYWRIAKSDLQRFARERTKGGVARILLVGELAAGMASDLEAAGWRTIVAQNPVDAVVRAIYNRPAVAVIDLVSLGEGGWTLAEKLRATRGTRKLSVILAAPKGAESDPEVMDRAVAVSAQGYLCGDVTTEAILSAVRDVLGG